MVDPTQMCPSSISPLGLFQVMVYIVDRLKGDLRARNHWWGPLLKRGHSALFSYHDEGTEWTKFVTLHLLFNYMDLGSMH